MKNTQALALSGPPILLGTGTCVPGFPWLAPAQLPRRAIELARNVGTGNPDVAQLVFIHCLQLADAQPPLSLPYEPSPDIVTNAAPGRRVAW